MRPGISFMLTAADRRRLEAIVADRNTPQKHVWRAAIVLLSADGVGTVEIMRRTGTSKTCVWRWQERFAAEGVEGLLRDKTRPSRVPPLGQEVIDRVVALTATEPPHEATHWTAAAMAKAGGHQPLVGAAHLEGARPGAAPHAPASSSPTTPSSCRSCATSSGSTSIRRPMPSCCRSTRRARSRRSTAPSPACR